MKKHGPGSVLWDGKSNTPLYVCLCGEVRTRIAEVIEHTDAEAWRALLRGELDSVITDYGVIDLTPYRAPGTVRV